MDFNTLEQWEVLSENERERLMATWDIYGEKGYWEKLFEQVVDELRQKLKANSNVTRVFGANHHGRLEVCVATVRGTPALPGFDGRKQRPLVNARAPSRVPQEHRNSPLRDVPASAHGCGALGRAAGTQRQVSTKVDVSG